MMNNQNVERLGTAPIGKLLAEYSLPAIASLLVMVACNFVDSIYIGKMVGITAAVNGMGLTLPIATLQTAFGVLVGIGGASRLSIVLGMGHKDWAEDVVSHAFWMSIFFSFVFIGGIQLFLTDLLIWMGGEGETLMYAEKYMRVLNMGSIFVTFVESFSAIVRAAGYSMKPMWIMLIVGIINAVLDPIFIFFFNMDVEGTAWATVIAMLVGTILLILHFYSKNSNLRLRIYPFRPNGIVIKYILGIGFSPFILNALLCIVQFIYNGKLSHYGNMIAPGYGAMVVGGRGLMAKYSNLFVQTLAGVAQGMQPIVGYNYGAGNKERLKKIFWLTMKIGLIITSIGFIVSEFFPKQICSIFTNDPELINATAFVMRIDMAMFPLAAVQVVMASFYQSISFVRSAIQLNLVRQAVFFLGLLYILPNFWGLNGVLISSPAADLLALAVCIYIYYREKKGAFGGEVASDILQ